jgi:DNA mismatch endonuclease (patch repair protein)
MARFPSQNTRPELALRRNLRQAGLLGYRIAPRYITGKPDVAYIGQKVAVFVDGEFWHGHPRTFQPGTRGPYWDSKIARNRTRDATVTTTLQANGWTVLRFWDSEVEKAPGEIVAMVAAALGRRPTGSQTSSRYSRAARTRP